jgi:glycosyltransferase involved in cell wall biosynthesis
VARRRPELETRFVGYGPLEGELRSLLHELGLGAEIRDGSAPGAITSALSDTHLLISPSRTASDGDAESLGLVNLEALASGIPVVTTRHGGIPEAVSPEAAAMVGEGDVAALASAVDDLLDKPSRWPAMGRAGRDHVSRHFDLRTQVAHVEAEYLALLQRS